MVPLKNYFRNLNLFEESDDNNEAVDEQQQQRRINIIATRVYLIFLILILICVGIFTWLNITIITITIEHPSEEQFHYLPPDAQCLCSRISLSFGEFTSLQPIFHQICSSDFVSDAWINAIYTDSNSTYFYIKDFRTFGSAQFQALAGFCRLANDNVQQSIATFNQNTFISSEVLSEDVLQAQIRSTIDQFQQTAPKTFASQLALIRRMTTSNKLVSGLQTNYIISYSSYPQVTPITYSNDNNVFCDCLSDFQCVSDAGFDDTFGEAIRTVHGQMKTLSGITSGCLPVTSILTSTLECFYNQTCLNNVISFFSTVKNFSAISIVNQSRFSPLATVQSMVDDLMVENWTVDISYQKYYNQCAPISCTYSKEEHHNLIYVTTRLISLLSGLTLVLRLIIPFVVRYVIKRLRRQRSRKISSK